MTLRERLSRGTIVLLGHVYQWPGASFTPIGHCAPIAKNRLVPWLHGRRPTPASTR